MSKGTGGWSPDQYSRFRSERKQPFTDLLALVERREAMNVVDLGCGTGELTRELHETLAASRTIGIDNSAEMLRLRESFQTEGLQLTQLDLLDFRPIRPLDLVFSNAALHWVTGHEALFERFRGWMAPGGQLAVQMPVNESHPSHAVAARVAEAGYGVPLRVTPVLQPEAYATLLNRLGFRRQHVRVQVYGHTLDSSEQVVEWVKGTLLTDYEKRLGSRFGGFLEDYRDALLGEIGQIAPYFYTFRRLLMHAA